jgi:hypothetical protein
MFEMMPMKAETQVHVVTNVFGISGLIEAPSA